MIIDEQNDAGYRSQQHPPNYYSKILRKELPSYVFQPVPQRLIWFFIHFAVIGLSITAILNKFYPLIFSILIGNSLGTLGFLGHEIIHGTVIKGRKFIIFFGSACMAHWGLYGKTWLAWHNKEHHQNTQHSFDDPDCFGRYQLYKNSRRLQILERFIPGSGTIVSYTFLFWFFSFHTAWIVLFNPQIFNKKRDLIESRIFWFFSHASWIILSIYSIPNGWIYFFLIPFMMSNFVFMSYISTNHFISPLTEEINDPLENSLTVIGLSFIHKMHLNNNYHVEHHVLPQVNPLYAELVSKKLIELWPEKYRAMNHVKAIKLVYKTSRFYFNHETLIHPKKLIKYKIDILDSLI